MNLVRYYSPIEEFDRIFRSYDENVLFSLPVDIEETEDAYIVTAELPGFTNEEIEVEVLSDLLVIKAEHKSETKEESSEEKTEEDNKPKFVFKERRTRNYVRRLRFRRPIQVNAATSKLANGILAVTLPKTEESKPVKLIPEMN